MPRSWTSLPYFLGGILILLKNWEGGEVEGNEYAAMTFKIPLRAYVWSNQSVYNPYGSLSEREKMLSEWVICSSGKYIQMHMVYYDDQMVNKPLQEQNVEQEYYWKYLNATGVLPGATILNTTYRGTFPFYTKPGDQIAYHTSYIRSYTTQLLIPCYDLIIEFPPNSGSWKTVKTIIDVTSFGLRRWRLTNSLQHTWHDIVENSTTLEPYLINTNPTPPPPATPAIPATPPTPPLTAPLPVPTPISLQNFTNRLFPLHIRPLENPCIPDLVSFYIIAQNRPTEFRRVYITTPLLMTDDEKKDWMDITDAFCSITTDANNVETKECGLVSKLIMTNRHLLALTSRGLYISAPFSSIPEKVWKNKDMRPILSFHLVNPCDGIKDLTYCFDSHDENNIPFPTPLIHHDAIEVHYLPVCHTMQYPNFRDIVTVVIHQDVVRNGTLHPPMKAVTILYSVEPYTKWRKLVESVSHFDNKSNEIRSIKHLYFNHVLNHFDTVAEIWTVGSERSRYVRFVLPLPTKPDEFYTELSAEKGNGFLPIYFPDSFEFLRLDVAVGSMDVFFMGNQLWISECGNTFVYQALARLLNPGNIEHCRFNHPDRNFVCVSQDHLVLLIGKVSTFYVPQEIQAVQIKEVEDTAIEELWIVKPDATANKIKRDKFEKYSASFLQKGLLGVHFTISYGGNLVMWYLQGAAGNEIELLESVGKLQSDKDSMFELFKTEYKIKSDARPRKFGNEPDEDPVRFAVKSIDIATLSKLSGKPTDAPLVPFLIDAITVALYEATFPRNAGMGEPRYITKADTGMTIVCQNTELITENMAEKIDCDLYIRHVKSLKGNWLPGFNSVLYAYVASSIPMFALKCHSEVHVNTRSNDAIIYIKRGPTAVNETYCLNMELPGSGGFSKLIGWTYYVPGHFSILINRILNSTVGPYSSPFGPTWTNISYHALGGLATVVVNDPVVVPLKNYEAFFINMTTRAYLDALHPYRHPLDTYNTTDPWKLVNSPCLFTLKLVDNKYIKSSGGSIMLDLHDKVSFSVKLLAKTNKGEIMMQQVLLKVTNSNPKLLKLKRTFVKSRQSQAFDILVTPTGRGKGIATVVVRLLTCSILCKTPCSVTYNFHMMRAPGRKLTVRFPIEIPQEEILAAGPGKEVVRNGSIVYLAIPPNYRPPSTHGPDIPTSDNIYNADPSLPKFRDWYKAAKESGTYKQCYGRLKRADCGCSQDDKLQDHPSFTDCKEMVYRTRRSKEFLVKLIYKPLMEPAFQNPAFFLQKPYYSVYIEEINGRRGYSIKSASSTYLETINTDTMLNRARKFYNTSDLMFTLHGTGIFHFKATLGEFDSFDEVSGYIVVYSDDNGLDDITFLVILFCSITLCFTFVFCGFLRVRKRLMSHLPRHDVMVIKDKRD